MQMMNLVVNPWFFRVWVMQEVALARSVTVLASGQPLNWSHLTTIAEMLTSSEYGTILQTGPGTGVEEESAFGRFNALLMAKWRNRQLDSQQLHELLGFCTNFRSTESVDRIYALLGLLRPESEVHQWRWPDYTKSVEEVYTLVAERIMPDGSNDLLSRAGIGWKRNLTALPSWVPD